MRNMWMLVAALACTPANGSERSGAPFVILEATTVAVGPDIALVIYWTPNDADSVRFEVERPAGTAIPSSPILYAPFSGEDTVAVGIRPAPGAAAAGAWGGTYWYDSSGVTVAGRFEGTGPMFPWTYFEPWTATSPPTADSAKVDTTLGALPSNGPVVAVEIWVDHPDGLSGMTAGETRQVCTLAQFEDGTWVAAAGASGEPAPAVCSLAASMRNPAPVGTQG